MNRDDIGSITIEGGRITMRYQDSMGSVTEVVHDHVTIEHLIRSAHSLAAWMDLRHENVSDECKRVHRKDQLNAEIMQQLREKLQDTDDLDVDLEDWL